jgi:hypothetical protein
MKTIKLRSISTIALAALLTVSAAGCSNAQVDSGVATATTPTATSTVSSSATSAAEGTVVDTSAAAVTDTSELFSDRDLEQSADLTAATQMNLVSNQDVTLSEAGVYVLSGEVTM